MSVRGIISREEVDLSKLLGYQMYKAIDLLSKTKNGLTIERLANALEVSGRTVARTLVKIRQAGIEVEKINNIWTTTYRIP